MSLKPETISQLQTLIQADPALVAQLQSCTDAASSAAVIAKAAAAKGLDVSAPDLMTHFEAAVAQQGAMSDTELEQVAGGAVAGPGGTVAGAWLVSIFTPITCAGVSFEAAIKNINCGDELNSKWR